VVVVHRASQPSELVLRGSIATIADAVEGAGLRRAAVVLVGPALAEDTGAGESWLYSAQRPRA
jgi:precorrin-4/cobalt-precorrin-4 C11-methyltransferase